MPNHVHLLTCPTTRDPRINTFLAAVKQPVAKFARERMEQAKSPLLERLLVKERPGKRCFRFWQEGAGYDRNLREYKSVNAAVTYIHANPVRKNLCGRPVDWKWSSARYYADSTVVDEELPSIYGLNRENPEIVTEQ
jgi:putative transposase